HRYGNGGPEVARVGAEIAEAREGARSVVGMKRREYKMASQRSLNRGLSDLGIADLTDHDDVRVLTQNGAQSRREGILAAIHLGLHDTGQMVLDRVLERDDFYIRGLNMA